MLNTEPKNVMKCLLNSNTPREQLDECKWLVQHASSVIIAKYANTHLCLQQQWKHVEFHQQSQHGTFHFQSFNTDIRGSLLLLLEWFMMHENVCNISLLQTNISIKVFCANSISWCIALFELKLKRGTTQWKSFYLNFI